MYNNVLIDIYEDDFVTAMNICAGWIEQQSKIVFAAAITRQMAVSKDSDQSLLVANIQVLVNLSVNCYGDSFILQRYLPQKVSITNDVEETIDGDRVYVMSTAKSATPSPFRSSTSQSHISRSARDKIKSS